MARPLVMRSSLRWLLSASVLLSALALWWPDDVSHAVAQAATATMPTGSPSPAVRTVIPDTLPIRLPERLPTLALDKASFDPFVGMQPPAPPPPKPFVGPVYVAPAPAPTPPTLPYRYLGQMTDPSGKKLHYLVKADKDVPIAVGTHLDEGYVVEAITADTIRLHYPQLDARAEIRIPSTRDSSAAP